ncbi:LysE family translocator [Actomonas aquatica]|uniref:LysE family transporter n=1 Tax=Actomonas aquatica TaxID=2866162 RepID=A0ABZ1CCV7_9BACT|nr:LysE family transporter [Opitutus sp. WL0086]WRQ89093.1 LysE family transporter [Opitutus sp. WL0086]
MDALWFEFGSVALAHALAVASPGPDFTLILRQSLVHGRATAVASAWGIGSGILVHVTISLLGVGALVRHQPQLFALLKYAGAAYLAWLGVMALRSRGSTAAPTTAEVAAPAPPHGRRAWLRGFLTNVLNPKATLFFIALFTVGISPETPVGVQALYGGWMAVATGAWFSLVAWVFTRERVRSVYQRGAVWIDRALGLVFIGFAASLLWV